MVSQTIAIHAPIKIVYETIVDFESYVDFLPEMKSAHVDWCEDAEMDASFIISVIKEIRYTLHFNLRPPQEVAWELKRGDLFKKNSGSWRLKSLKPERTEAKYSLELELGLWVPKSITQSLVEKTLPETLKRFKNRAEENFKKSKKKK